MKNILLVVTLAVGSSVYAHAQNAQIRNAQTIADVARRERAKKPADQSSLSVTNQNLKKKAANLTDEKPEAAPATPATTAPAAPAAAQAPAAAVPVAGQAVPVGDGRDEKWWKEKFDAARTDIRRAENQVALAQLELNNANRDYMTRSYDPDGRGLNAIAAARQKLADANTAVSSSRSKLAQLEEDLRRAGAPAGWGR
jgi:hypothetical protein